jgi:hypothetical protein
MRRYEYRVQRFSTSHKPAIFSRREMHVISAIGPLPSSVYITTCPQLAKAAVRAADEVAGLDPGCVKTRSGFDSRGMIPARFAEELDEALC